MHQFAEGDFHFPHSDIDIEVRCDDKTVTGRVSSAAMVLASPIWKKFVFPPWEVPQLTAPLNGKYTLMIDLSPHQANNNVGDHGHAFSGVPVAATKKIDFTEDDPQALRILLKIIHFQFQDIPAELEHRTLLHIAALCEQYMCVHLVVPWLSKWLNKASILNLESDSDFAEENCLFIYWVFGLSKSFHRLANELVLCAEEEEDGSYVFIEPPCGPVPPGIISQCTITRGV